jgi:hypothetical protein
MKKIKTYKIFNESLKDKIKGKSNDDILNSIKNMIPEHKFINACKHHLTWLVEKLIQDGNDPSFNDNMCLINCGILEYNDIVNILMKNDKVISQLYRTQLERVMILNNYDDDYDDGEVPYDEDESPYVNWHFGEEEEDEEYEDDDYGEEVVM